VKNKHRISIEEARAILDHPHAEVSPEYKYVDKGMEEYDGEYSCNGYLVFSFEDKNYIIYYTRSIYDVYFANEDEDEDENFIIAEEAEEFTYTMTEWRVKV